MLLEWWLDQEGFGLIAATITRNHANISLQSYQDLHF